MCSCKVSLRNKCTWYNPPYFTPDRTLRRCADWTLRRSCKVSLRNKCIWYNPPDFTTDRTLRRCADWLYLPHAPTLENPCDMSILALLCFLHGCNSSRRAQAGTSASCIHKMCSCFCPTFLLDEHHPFLCPFLFLYLSGDYRLSVLKRLLATKDHQPSRCDTM